MQEHRTIEQVILCLEEMADRCEAGQRLDSASAGEALDFFRVFADRCHHGKEEDLLFPLMESKGFSREHGPTGVMLDEHQQGRRHIRAMSEALERISSGDIGAQGPFIEHARRYAELLRQHIFKEDHCLFPMAEQVLSETDQSALSQSFSKAEREELGLEVHKKYVAIADRLAERFGKMKPASAAQPLPCCDHH
jgi:hemerythrin-like domain-containing protein